MDAVRGWDRRTARRLVFGDDRSFSCVWPFCLASGLNEPVTPLKPTAWAIAAPGVVEIDVSTLEPLPALGWRPSKARNRDDAASSGFTGTAAGLPDADVMPA